MASKTFETLVVAVIVILIAIFAYQQLGKLILGQMEKAVTVERKVTL